MLALGLMTSLEKQKMGIIRGELTNKTDFPARKEGKKLKNPRMNNML
jgi:hypothetical protein